MSRGVATARRNLIPNELDRVETAFTFGEYAATSSDLESGYAA